jgi:hypothetical protein
MAFDRGIYGVELEWEDILKVIEGHLGTFQHRHEQSLMIPQTIAEEQLEQMLE